MKEEVYIVRKSEAAELWDIAMSAAVKSFNNECTDDQFAAMVHDFRKKLDEIALDATENS